MIKVSCPNCGVRLTASDNHVGQPVNCQKCNTKFILSKRWMNEPLGELPVASDSNENNGVRGSDSNPLIGGKAAETGAGRFLNIFESESAVRIDDSAVDPFAIRRGATGLDGFVESYSIIEFFDFRFRRYLTPTIIKMSWLLVMAVAMIWILIISYTFVSSLIQNGDVQFDVSAGNSAPNSSAPLETSPMFSPFFVRSGLFFSSLAAVFLAVLWIRVAFESIIMLFSVGNSLRAIKEGLKG